MAECWVIKSHRLQVYIRDQSSLFLWDIARLNMKMKSSIT